MLRVSLSQVVRTENGDVPELLAQLRVDAKGIEAEGGERTKEVLAIPVLDPRSGERVESGKDPVRWARLLPQAIRSGDLVVFVEEVADESPRGERDGPMEALADELAEDRSAVAAH
jgi:hypothetical protein